jgi:CBS domain-containing protein
MVAAGATPRHLGLAVSAVVDAITVRLLEAAEAALGPAPVPYAWLALGSQARHEQTVLTDQDNALLLDDALDPAAHDAYFDALARFVNEGLAACGFPFCPGEVMARNPRWRRPLQAWRAQFDAWIERPEPMALMQASHFFDLRAAAGDARLAERLLAHVRQKVVGNEVFVARMVANAIRNRPPLGFFRNLVVDSGGEHGDTLDLKLGGIMPIVELARIYALITGTAAIGTVERLRAGAEGRAVSREGAEDLEHALAFVSTLRARHQAGQLKRGVPPDSRVRPGELSALERAQLKDAFAVVRDHQELIAQVYRARSFV